mgnify:CR=1 FL=1
MKDAHDSTDKYDWENGEKMENILRRDNVMIFINHRYRKSETSEPTCYEKINGIDYQNQ